MRNLGHRKVIAGILLGVCLLIIPATPVLAVVSATAYNNQNVAEDIEIQGTDIEGGAYDWTLAAAGDQIYSVNNGLHSMICVYKLRRFL